MTEKARRKMKYYMEETTRLSEMAEEKGKTFKAASRKLQILYTQHNGNDTKTAKKELGKARHDFYTTSSKLHKLLNNTHRLNTNHPSATKPSKRELENIMEWATTKEIPMINPYPLNH